MSIFTYAPLGDAQLDRFQQNVARAFLRVEALLLELQETVEPMAMVRVATKPITSTAGASFDGLKGDADDTLGYVLRYRARPASTGTSVALRINGDTGASAYRWALATQASDGSLATGGGSDVANMIRLSSTSANPGHVITGTVTIPVSRRGEARHVHADTIESNVFRGDYARGSWVNTTDEIKRIDILSIFGTLNDGVATLYRMVR